MKLHQGVMAGGSATLEFEIIGPPGLPFSNGFSRRRNQSLKVWGAKRGISRSGAIPAANFAMEAKPGATPKKLLDGFNAAMQLSGDGKTLLLTRTSLTIPSEVFVAASDGTELRPITH